MDAATKALDIIVKENTVWSTFNEMIKACECNFYRPTLRADLDRRLEVVAIAFDLYFENIGSKKRAYLVM